MKAVISPVEKKKQLLELAGRRERVQNTPLGQVGAGFTGTFDGAVGLVSGKGYDHHDIKYLREKNNKLATYIDNLINTDLNSIYKTKNKTAWSPFGNRISSIFDEESSYAALLVKYNPNDIRTPPLKAAPAAEAAAAEAAAAVAGAGAGDGGAAAAGGGVPHAAAGGEAGERAAAEGVHGAGGAGAGGDGGGAGGGGHAAPLPRPPAAGGGGGGEALSLTAELGYPAAARGGAEAGPRLSFTAPPAAPPPAAAAGAAPPLPPAPFEPALAPPTPPPHRRPAAPPPATEPPPPPAAAGGPGGGAGAEEPPGFIDSAAGAAAAGLLATIPAASNFVERVVRGENLLNAVVAANNEIVDAGQTGFQGGLTGGGVQSAYQKTVLAGVRVSVDGGQGGADGQGGEGHRGGGPRGAAPPQTTADDKAKEEAARLAADQAAAAAAADAAAAAADKAAAAQAAAKIDEETERKKLLASLQVLNPEARLEVFCDDENKKRQYDAKLETLLRHEPNYEKNKDSAFICFISPSDKPGTNNTPLPYVTNGDFLEILAKDSFPKDSNKGIRICKMDLDPKDEGVVMGGSRLREQHWIDVKDKKNTTRIFIDKENFQNLTDYKKLLTAKFEEFLRGDFSKVLSSTANPAYNEADKGTIKNAIDGFGGAKDIVDKTGTAAPAPAPAPQTSVASKLGINDTEIQKKAQEFAEDFLQRRIMKGNLNCEKETTPTTTPATFENQEIGHIKIVRPHADPKKIEVYKVGNSNLEHVNLALDSNQIMQIRTSNITENEIKDVKYYNVRSSTQLAKSQINKEALAVKVDVFVKAGNGWDGHKIREGGHESKKGDIKKVATPFEDGPLEKVPKIFTIETDGLSNKIGTANGWRLGYLRLPKRIVGDGDVDIKIRRSEKGNYEIQYGENKCCSWLSNYRGVYLINPDITEIVGVMNNSNQQEKLGFKKKGTIISNPFSCRRSGVFDKFKIEVEDKQLNKMVTLEVEKVGIRRGAFWARNKFVVNEVSSRALPVTALEAQAAVSSPSLAPAPTKTSCWPACLGGGRAAAQAAGPATVR